MHGEQRGRRRHHGERAHRHGEERRLVVLPGRRADPASSPRDLMGVAEELVDRLGRPPTIGELAASLDADPERCLELWLDRAR